MNLNSVIQISLFLIVLAVSYFAWIAFVPYAIYMVYVIGSRILDVKHVELSKEYEKSVSYKLAELESRVGRVEMNQV
jgi:hypothetical protein